jgi:hypothetical protein
MRRVLAALICTVLTSTALGQGILSDVFSGKLINPEVGVFAWYELTDAETGMKFFLRQAVVEEEKVKRKTGYWVETELTPQVGFPMIYKMLLTGPAYEEGNVHKVVVKEGTQAPREVPIDPEAFTDTAQGSDDRTLVGTENLTVAGKELACEHYRVGQGEDVTDLWVNDTVRPLGVVKMKTPQGVLQLQRFGKGGADGASAINRATPGGPSKKTDVEVRVGDEPTTNFNGGN